MSFASFTIITRVQSNPFWIYELKNSNGSFPQSKIIVKQLEYTVIPNEHN